MLNTNDQLTEIDVDNLLLSLNRSLEIIELNNIISNKKEYIIGDINNKIETYKNKCVLHIYYLKCVMLITMCILYELNFYDRINFYITCFLVLFNIAFIQNMISNLQIKKYNKENESILEAQNKINILNKVC